MAEKKVLLWLLMVQLWKCELFLEAQERILNTTYIVTEDLEGVFAGKTAPWFNQKGGGMQFKLPDKIVNIKSHLQEVFINDV